MLISNAVSYRLIRSIYPLWLREKLCFRFVWRSKLLPPMPQGGFPLEYGDTALANLCPTDGMHKQIAWFGFYERGLSAEISKLAHEVGGLFVDVGANAGYFSCIWTSKRRNNQCLAIEASPRNCELLTSNIERSNLRTQVEIRNLGASNQNGVLEFDLGPVEQTGWGRLSTGKMKNKGGSIEVPVAKLDDLISTNDSISVLKIDVEGTETWVLEGASNLLANRRIHRIFFEHDPILMGQYGIREASAINMLKDYGFSVTPMPESRGREMAAILR